MKMKPLKIDRSTPLTDIGLVTGDYYIIDNGTQTKIGQLISATIWNAVFRIYVSDGIVVYDELKLPIISLIDSPITLTHIGDELPINQVSEILCDMQKDEMM